MPDLFSIVGALKDLGRINETEMTELWGTTMRPQYNEVLSILVEKNYLTAEERKGMLYPDPNKLYAMLQQKGVLY